MISITRDIGLVSFTGNPILLSIQSTNYEVGGVPRPFYTVFCEVFLTDPALGGAADYIDSIQVDSLGKGKFDLKGILKDHTKPTIPWPLTAETQAVIDTNAKVAFWLRFSDGYGIPFVKQSAVLTTNVYYAIPGGLSDDILEQIEAAESNCYQFLLANKLFLTSQPNGKRSALNQPEILRFLNLTENTTLQLAVKQTMFSGEVSYSVLWNDMIPHLSLCTFNVTPGVSFTLLSDVMEWEIFIRAGEVFDNIEVFNEPLTTASTEPDWTITNDGLTLSAFPLATDYFQAAANAGDSSAKIFFPDIDPLRIYKVSFERKGSTDGSNLIFLGGFDGFEIECTLAWLPADATLLGSKLIEFGFHMLVKNASNIQIRNLKVEEVIYEQYSESVTYRPLEFPVTNPRCFFFQNSLGGFDSLLSVGSRNLTLEGETVSGYIAEESNLRKWLRPTQERRTVKNIYRGSLGYFTNDELLWLNEFFLSESKLLVYSEKLYEVTLRQDEFSGVSDDPPGKVNIEAILGAPFLFFFRRVRELTFAPVVPTLLTEDGFDFLFEDDSLIIL